MLGRVDLLGDPQAGVPPARLDEVTWCEEFVADRLALTRTPAGQRDARLAADGVYYISDQLFHWYAAGGFGQMPAAEALKRAVWFAWAASALPCEDTGVDALDDGPVLQVFEGAARHLVTHTEEEELRDMLAWYHHVAPLAFGRFPSVAALSASLAARAPLGWQLRGWDLEQFHGRGALGRYWTNLLKRHA